MTGFQSIRAVVTGASSGIGREVAIEIARRAATKTPGDDRAMTSSPALLVHFRSNRQGAEETARQIRAHGVAADLAQADLSDAADRASLVDAAWQFLGVPTTWINNAGADVLTGDLAKQTFEKKLRVLMEVDVIGTIDLARQVVDRWRSGGPQDDPPSMTFIGWDQAPRGMEGDAGQMFGPVKAAVMAFANSLAQEVAPAIRVNTVAPGWIKTAWGETTDHYWDGRAKRQSLAERWGKPIDVARAVCFVADPENTFCYGQSIEANGGWNRTHPK
jgi:3-oxoacyl-[acyl-carrier protein] reductase